jgi:hypothetical protein
MKEILNSPIEFAKATKDLARNPLGIIALFIVLVYAMACLVVAFGTNLDPSQKTPLVWFLVIFPLIVLMVFGWLVSKHHRKLYAPSDYKDETLFVYPQDEETQRRHLLEEALAEEVEEAKEKSPEGSEPAKGNSQFDSEPNNFPLPETKADKESIISEHALAEDLAIWQLEDELKVSFARQMVIDFSGGNQGTFFDGVFVDGKTARVIAVDVKYTRRSHLHTPQIQATLYRFLEVYNHLSAAELGKSTQLIFVIVTELSGGELERYSLKLKNRYNTLPIPLEWRFYNFSELREKFRNRITNK